MNRDLIALQYVTHGERAALEATARRLPRGWGKALDALAAIYRDDLRARTPVSHHGGPRTTHVRDHWKIKASGSGATSTRVVYNDDPALGWILRGRKAIDQTTKTGAARHPLHFWVDGLELYRWRVRAVAPNNFIPAAMAAARRKALHRLPVEARRIMARRVV